MAVAEVTNIVIEKGTDFDATFVVFNSDDSAASFSGASAVAKIRKHPTSPSSVSFTVTINENAGSISIALTKEQTALLSTGRNYYDILVTKDSKTFKIIKGTAIVEESASL
jgi:hypothetical protein